MDGDDLALFERSLEHATASHTGAALDAVLDDLGWRDALAVDDRAAVSVLFALQGAANVTSSALVHVLAHALGRDGSAVLLPAIGTWNAPGAPAGAAFAIHGIGTSSLDARDTCLVVVRVGDSHLAHEIETASLARRRIEGIDPSLGLVEVTAEVAAAGTSLAAAVAAAVTGPAAGEATGEAGPVDWGAAVARGQLALGHELVGAARAMLALARQHALDRIQFGQPIARFQAVRHRLAETLVAIEAADAVLDAAWLDGGQQAAAMAKATAGRSARVAARHCQQVLAGIGFTTEHPFHRYLKRVLVLEQLLGGTRDLTRELGRDIAEHRRLPALLPL
jgi:hypothetical protein